MNKVNLQSLSIFIAADLLFSPYLKPLPFTFGLIILCFIIPIRLISLRFRTSRDVFFLFIFLTLAFASFAFLNIWPLAILPSVSDNINLFIQSAAALLPLFAIVVIYSSFSLCFLGPKKRGLSIPMLYQALKLLILYLLFNFFLSLLYFRDYLGYFQVRQIWTYGSSATDNLGVFSNITRFTGIMSDPNNAACGLVAVYASIVVILIILNRLNNLSFVLLSLISLFVVVCTMSNTGIIAFLITFFLLQLSKISPGSLAKFKLPKSLFYTLFSIFILGGVFALAFSSTDLFQLNLERLELSTLSFFSRIDRIPLYSTSFNWLAHLFIGTGGIVIINGSETLPTLGFFTVAMNYGLFSLVLFLIVFFRIKAPKLLSLVYLPIIPLLICFIVNTGVLDFRFAIVFALISCLHSYIAENYHYVSAS